ncbi:MAG: ATP-dependent Clp protease adaptor ClpS [Desulfomonile tiedjei]|uniref:ATP-dependent Clp protease adaptor ClpS n=1 Tax=Desulfomonile tiedjei TaxID=2358 RepID=A0A9D6Z5U2_9BACT|nr:ATP-dependent Clp protease adaptor ClpS [Desulfomonile tiedjei]
MASAFRIAAGLEFGRNRTQEIHCYKSRVFDPIVIPTKNEDTDSQNEELYEVRIIDNDHNTYGEVIQITMLALGISEEGAYAVAWEVDHYGSCVVAQACKAEAERLASIIRLIGIEVRVQPVNGRV